MPARTSERVAMPELFDMIAGSETGAIIASSLAIKNPDASSP
jgi:patatin-like phospholipase/acyl hydrolase